MKQKTSHPALETDPNRKKTLGRPRAFFGRSPVTNYFPKLLKIYFEMAFPSPSKTYHTAPYTEIDPASARLSTKGKNIVISGGGSGIGEHIAQAFAKSGVNSISLLGRTQKTLQANKEKISASHPKIQVHTFQTDISDESSVTKAFEGISSAVQGKVDVLIANAGYLPDLSTIANASLKDWYQGFEVNVKGNFNLVKAFLPYASQNAAVINVR